jgi:hypothetical protein
MTSLLSEAQHHIMQVVFSGTPSSYDTHETPHPPISQSHPNCFKDLPEIRGEPFAVDYLPSNSNRFSIDNDMMPAPVHIVCPHDQSHQELTETLRIAFWNWPVDDFYARLQLSGRVISAMF